MCGPYPGCSLNGLGTMPGGGLGTMPGGDLGTMPGGGLGMMPGGGLGMMLGGGLGTMPGGGLGMMLGGGLGMMLGGGLGMMLGLCSSDVLNSSVIVLGMRDCPLSQTNKLCTLGLSNVLVIIESYTAKTKQKNLQYTQKSNYCDNYCTQHGTLSDQH